MQNNKRTSNALWYGIILLAFLFAVAGCTHVKKENQQVNKANKQEKVQKHSDKKPVDKFPELSPEEHYHAIVADSMTLAEVAKANNIGLPFLKTSLGIPQHLKHNYPISQLKKNFRFTTQQLKTIIEDAKNRSKVQEKKRKRK